MTDNANRLYLLSFLDAAAQCETWTHDDWDESIADAASNATADGALSSDTRSMWAGLHQLLTRARPIEAPRTNDGGEVLDPAILGWG